jgi:chromate reductase
MHVAALVGRLRHRSYSRMTYNAAVSPAPDGLTFEEADIGSLPLYDDDLRAQQGYPPAASRLRERIAAAAGRLIDEAAREAITAQLQAFEAWVRRLGGG